MTRSKIAIAVALGALALAFIVQPPAVTQPMQPPMTPHDAATTGAYGDLAFRTPIGCDQFVSKDLKGPGDFGLVGATGRHLYVCSYSISNGSALQDVQFISGTEASSPAKYGPECSPGLAVTAKFHLLSDQFVSQGSGVGSLFTTGGRGLCLRVMGNGEVSVNVTYAVF